MTCGPLCIPDRLLWMLVREENVGHTLYFHVVCGVVFFLISVPMCFFST